jgi:hypothetical protein
VRLREFIPAPVRLLQRQVRERLWPWPHSIQLGFDPSDRAAAESAAERLFEARQEERPLGTVGRSRLLLRIIENSFPTERLSSEYFQNLGVLFRSKPRRLTPGKVLIGVGSGRSGSTSLAALLATIDESCCTHENPPLIYWTPDDAQIQFHIRRLKLLADHYAVVSDVSHWWLNVLDTIFEHFPESKVVGLFRDVDQCAESFMHIKGSGRHSLNHWAPYGNGVWRPHIWDLTYPSYQPPNYCIEQPDRAKREMIVRYIDDYNARLKEQAVHYPERIVLVRTEELSDPAVQMMILNLAGGTGKPLKHKLNAGTVTDGEDDEFIY